MPSIDYRSRKTKQILSCFGKMTNVSTARILGVSKAWVTFIWQRAGLDYTDEYFLNGYFLFKTKIRTIFKLSKSLYTFVLSNNFVSL